MSTTVIHDHSEKRINLDFGDTRRKSFLPDDLQRKESSFATGLKTVRIIECGEEDDIYMYLSQSGGNEERPVQKFVTGSKYLGEWNQLGMSGKGVYKYPHGVIYDGFLNKNGEFHGNGVLIYPNGQRIEGLWKNGKLGTDVNFVTSAGVVMNKTHAQESDRRFQVEQEYDLNPPGQEYLTDELPPPRTIPSGCYDLVEGYYDPKVKTVYAYPKRKTSKNALTDEERGLLKRIKSNKSVRSAKSVDSQLGVGLFVDKGTQSEVGFTNIMRERTASVNTKQVSWIPSVTQEEWIKSNCRKAWDEPVGYRPDLYEEWTKSSYDNNLNQRRSYRSDYEIMLNALKMTESKSGSAPWMKSFIQRKNEEQEQRLLNLTKRIVTGKSIFSESDIKERKLTISQVYVNNL